MFLRNQRGLTSTKLGLKRNLLIRSVDISQKLLFHNESNSNCAAFNYIDQINKFNTRVCYILLYRSIFKNYCYVGHFNIWTFLNVLRRRHDFPWTYFLNQKLASLSYQRLKTLLPFVKCRSMLYYSRKWIIQVRVVFRFSHSLRALIWHNWLGKRKFGRTQINTLRDDIYSSRRMRGIIMQVFLQAWLSWWSVGLSRGRSWVQLRPDQHSGSLNKWGESAAFVISSAIG